MSRKQYPIDTWDTGTRKRRPGADSCSKCRVPFGENEPFVVRETQVSWMRGEDEVDFFHFKCAPGNYWKNKRQGRK